MNCFGFIVLVLLFLFLLTAFQEIPNMLRSCHLFPISAVNCHFSFTCKQHNMSLCKCALMNSFGLQQCPGFLYSSSHENVNIFISMQKRRSRQRNILLSMLPHLQLIYRKLKPALAVDLLSESCATFHIKSLKT